MITDQLRQRHCVTKKIHAKKLKAMQQNIPAKKFQSPLVVMGLPRTGTTFLHGLLAMNEKDFRAPRFHEYMDACPEPASSEITSFADLIRVKIADMKMNFIRMLLPSMSSLHHIDALTPEEDVVPLGQVMVSAMYPTTFYAPTYMKWLQTNSSRKFTHSLRYLKDYLDVHMRQGNETWLLKTPWHVAQLGEFSEVFPGTRFVWTHRDPVQVATSLSSLVLHMVGISSERPYHVESRDLISKEVVNFWLWCLERGVDARKRLEARGVIFVDVDFEYLNHNPLEVAEKIYQKFNLPISPELKNKFSKYIKENRRGKRGTHVHDVNSRSSFTLDLNSIRERYNQIMDKIRLNLV